MNKTFILLLVLVLLSIPVYSQSSRILELDNEKAYLLIERLKDRGFLGQLNPISLPYTHAEVRKELNAVEVKGLSRVEKIWIDQLADEIQFYPKDLKRDYIVAPYVISGSEFNNTENKNIYRPTSDQYYAWPYTDLGFFTDFKRFTLNTNIRFDLYYEFGDEGIDSANRLYIRNEDSYLGYTSEYFSAYLGRMENQWGIYGSNSTFISDNPRTFDQLKFKIGSNKLNFSSINGILDNISADGVFRGNTKDDPDSKRRYLSIKKLDWQVNENLLLSFREGILYSGTNVSLSPKYMVPSFLYFFLEAAAPSDQVENLLLGGALWFNRNNFTLHTEIMLDDLITNREERGLSEKTNFSIVSNLSYSLPTAPFTFNLDAEVFTYQVYNTDQAEGRYLYLNRGLATQHNDFAFAEFKTDFFADLLLMGLRVSPYYGILLQGEQTINQTFSSEYPDGNAYEYALTGTIETTQRAGLDIRFDPFKFIWVKADLGLNLITNKNNVTGISENRLAGMFEIGFIYR